MWSGTSSASVLVIIDLGRFIGIAYPTVINTKRRFPWRLFGTVTALICFYQCYAYSSLWRGVISVGFCIIHNHGSRTRSYFGLCDYVSLVLTSLLPFLCIVTMDITITKIFINGKRSFVCDRANPIEWVRKRSWFLYYWLLWYQHYLMRYSFLFK